MAIHTEQDMSKIPAMGDLVPEGWYHVRVKSVTEKVDDKSNTRVLIQLAVQNEPHVGRLIFDNPQLNHNLGLQKLKTYYKAAGYTPGPEGHDPEKLVDCEFWVAVEHTIDGENRYANVMGWSIRSLQEGQGKKVYAK